MRISKRLLLYIYVKRFHLTSNFQLPLEDNILFSQLLLHIGDCVDQYSQKANYSALNIYQLEKIRVLQRCCNLSQNLHFSWLRIYILDKFLQSIPAKYVYQQTTISPPLNNRDWIDLAITDRWREYLSMNDFKNSRKQSYTIQVMYQSEFQLVIKSPESVIIWDADTNKLIKFVP